MGRSILALPLEVTQIDHRAPSYSMERTCYFDGLMDRYARDGDRYLVFTPPSTRGSLLTRAESWAINFQRPYVPTLIDDGRWPVTDHRDHPSLLSPDQTEWLSSRWGECASLWRRKGWRPDQQTADAALVGRHPTTRLSIDREVYAAAIEAAARQEREYDLGSMDANRRPIGLPGWPRSPEWHEIGHDLRLVYLRRVGRVIRAFRSAISPIPTKEAGRG